MPLKGGNRASISSIILAHHAFINSNVLIVLRIALSVASINKKMVDIPFGMHFFLDKSPRTTTICTDDIAHTFTSLIDLSFIILSLPCSNVEIFVKIQGLR